ncbi:hypothetical protein [Streptomyces synnematoformans]|uniref:DUF222 domain-containing protein n=1 Tax=Streptomyces synnematoformans TaxID=415721 RepID=A0ABN2YVX0_9ACTN
MIDDTFTAMAREVCAGRPELVTDIAQAGRLTAWEAPDTNETELRDAMAAELRAATRCGARRPGYDQRPAIGRNSIPCVHEHGHEGTHANAFGDRWAL